MNTTTASRFLSLRRFAPFFLLSALAAPLPVHAHAVWIEDTPDGRLVVRFGEPGDEFEKSPGHLDSLTLPEAWAFDAEGKPAAFEVQKKSDHFLFLAASSAAVALGETGFPVMQRGDNPATKPFFHVRWMPAGAVAEETKPALTLDLVPTAEAGVFRVYFRGEPLAGAEITVHAPDAEYELVADDAGRVRFTATTSGLHLLTANHREPVRGFAGGRAHDRVSHNVVLTWRQP